MWHKWTWKGAEKLLSCGHRPDRSEWPGWEPPTLISCLNCTHLRGVQIHPWHVQDRSWWAIHVQSGCHQGHIKLQKERFHTEVRKAPLQREYSRHGKAYLRRSRWASSLFQFKKYLRSLCKDLRYYSTNKLPNYLAGASAGSSLARLRHRW